jgi:hypothetical protein
MLSYVALTYIALVETGSKHLELNIDGRNGYRGMHMRLPVSKWSFSAGYRGGPRPSSTDQAAQLIPISFVLDVLDINPSTLHGNSVNLLPRVGPQHLPHLTQTQRGASLLTCKANHRPYTRHARACHSTVECGHQRHRLCEAQSRF